MQPVPESIVAGALRWYGYADRNLPSLARKMKTHGGARVMPVGDELFFGDTASALSAELAAFQAARGLPAQCAAEQLNDVTDPADRAWLAEFCRRWEDYAN